jgi:anti-anti-sigma factor
MLTCEKSSESGLTVFQLSGRLDHLTGPTLETAVQAAIAANELDVLLDCGGLEYVSSAGLRVVLVLAKALDSRDGNLSFSSIRPEILRIFELTNFDSIFPIYKTRQEALAERT